jgi:hypothetical protein
MKKRLLFTLLATTAASIVSAETVLPTRAILPVAGSVQGAFNSHFRTELQLNNRSEQTMKGMVVFHPIGQSASASDPMVHFELAPHQTLAYGDVVGMFGVAGLGSVEIISEKKGLPTAVARAFDDGGGVDGTKGTVIPAIRPDEALQSGQSASLIVPMDLTRYRFNVGIRSMESGAAIKVIVFGASGIERKRFDLFYPADYLIQAPADALVGEPLLANETLVFQIAGGSAIVYGTTTDNTTNDPSIQIANSTAE